MNEKYNVYLVSDSTGETLDRIFLSIKSQFANFEYEKKEFAFVRTEQGVEGLLHVSEISNEEITSVEEIENVVSVGQKLNLTIVNVDAERKRLGLSIISSGNISEVTDSEETPEEETPEEETPEQEATEETEIDESENSDSDASESSKESE